MFTIKYNSRLGNYYINIHLQQESYDVLLRFLQTQKQYVKAICDNSKFLLCYEEVNASPVAKS